jgi:hypothetical protein
MIAGPARRPAVAVCASRLTPTSILIEATARIGESEFIRSMRGRAVAATLTAATARKEKQGVRASRSTDGRSADQFNPQPSYRRGADGLHAIMGCLSGNGPRIATRSFPAFSSIAAP